MRWHTPPQVARQLGVPAWKVLSWVHSGQLEANDLSENKRIRARWRISQEALDRFLESRSNKKSTQPPVGRPKADSDTIEFYE